MKLFVLNLFDEIISYNYTFKMPGYTLYDNFFIKYMYL